MTHAFRVLLLGATSQVGKAFLRTPHPSTWEVFSDAALSGTLEEDVGRGILEETSPHLILNAAAPLSVDEAACDIDRARALHFDAVVSLAAWCACRDVELIHLSSVEVFAEDAPGACVPHAPMTPTNPYGESRMWGEEAVRQQLPWATILRLADVFGPDEAPDNLLTATLAEVSNAAGGGQRPLRTPTPASAVAEVLGTLVEAARLGRPERLGIFHFCGAPACSDDVWRAAVRESFEETKAGTQLSVVPAVSTSSEGFAGRTLDCASTCAAFGLVQPDWREALRSLKRQSGA